MPKRLKALRGLLVAVLAGAGVLTVTTGPATADPYPVIGDPYPDRGNHSFCFTPVFAQYSALVSRARYSMDNNDGVEAQTVVDTVEQNCGTNTDVLFYVRDMGSDTIGHTDCLRVAPTTGYCNSWSVSIGWSLIQSAARPGRAGYAARHTLCHEIGHSLGVNHYFQGFPPGDDTVNSCLIAGLWDDGVAWQRTYGPDHRDHIRRWFT